MNDSINLESYLLEYHPELSLDESDRTVEIIGDDQFKSAFVEKQESAPRTITVDSKGQIQGDTSAIDPYILEQLTTPESQAKIRDQYRSYHYGAEPKREVKYLNEREDRRPLADSKPRGVDSKTWRRAYRKMARKLTKATMKAQRSINHG